RHGFVYGEPDRVPRPAKVGLLRARAQGQCDHACGRRSGHDEVKLEGGWKSGVELEIRALLLGDRQQPSREIEFFVSPERVRVPQEKRQQQAVDQRVSSRQPDPVSHTPWTQFASGLFHRNVFDLRPAASRITSNEAPADAGSRMLTW